MTLPKFFITILSQYFRWLAIGVAVVILVFGYVLVINGKISSIRTNGLTQRQQIQDELKGAKAYDEQLKTAITNFHQVLPPEKLAKINEFLPTSSDFPGLMLTINNIAQVGHVKLDNITLGQVGQVADAGTSSGGNLSAAGNVARAAPSTSTLIKTQDAGVTFSGGTSYQDFKNFLGLIESSQRLMDVVSLSFTNQAQSSTSGSESQGGIFGMTIRTYYLPSS